jgi:hypothetical protein
MNRKTACLLAGLRQKGGAASLAAPCRTIQRGVECYSPFKYNRGLPGRRKP